MGMFDLIKTLSDADIEYVLVGGLAVALHGYQRVTMDVDVALSMDEENMRRFIGCAKAAGPRPVIPVPIDSLANPELIEQWHREMGQAGKPRSGCSQKGMLAFALRGPDMMASHRRAGQAGGALCRPAARCRHHRPLKVPVASIAHLIAMKTGTGRGKDAIDIEELRKIQAGKTP